MYNLRCSVYKAATQLSSADLTGLGVRSPWVDVITRLDTPELAETDEQSGKIDIFEFQSGFYQAYRGRIIPHLAADVFTLTTNLRNRWLFRLIGLCQGVDGLAHIRVPRKRCNTKRFILAFTLVLFFVAAGTAHASAPSDGTVASFGKISDTEGFFSGPLNPGGALDDNDQLGHWVADIGDLDGDGVSDLAVTAIRDDDGGLESGAIWILFMNTNGTVKSKQKISDTEGFLSGPLNPGGVLAPSDFFGHMVVSIGDLDGDGVTDLAVGAVQDDDGGSNRGAVYILFLDNDGTVKSKQKISDSEGFLSGPLNPGGALDDGDQFGVSVTSIGDLDGDGISDLAVGATGDDDGGSLRGAVYVLFLNTDGTVKSKQKISDSEGFLSGPMNPGGLLDNVDNFGLSVGSIGDLDGDDISDLAVGAVGDDDGGSRRGAVYVLFLNTDGTVKSKQKISDTAGFLSGPLNPGGVLEDVDLFGYSVANIGDRNGDGVTDLAVGAVGDDDGGSGRGAVYVLFMTNLVLTVDIDIKPGSYPNSINLGSHGVIPVAILSSVDFDATQIDPATVTLAGSEVAIRGKGKLLAHQEDINGDGLLDLVVQVETENLDSGQFQDGNAKITGETFSGDLIVGYDEINIVP